MDVAAGQLARPFGGGAEGGIVEPAVERAHRNEHDPARDRAERQSDILGAARQGGRKANRGAVTSEVASPRLDAECAA